METQDRESFLALLMNLEKLFLLHVISSMDSIYWMVNVWIKIFLDTLKTISQVGTQNAIVIARLVLKAHETALNVPSALYFLIGIDVSLM